MMSQGRLWQASAARVFNRHAMASASPARPSRYQAFDAGFGPEELAAARTWFRAFRQGTLPKGNTTYSRSSGPGGQHVNKTETKATTSWPVDELAAVLPRLLHAGIRSSKYYSSRNDAISIQAQTERSRSANTEENREKLYDELVRIYRETVPGENDPAKKEKWDAVEKSFHRGRIRQKTLQGAKKQSRRKGAADD